MAPGKRRENRNKDFPEFGSLEGGRCAHGSGTPNQISQLCRWRNFDGCYVLQRQQQIVSCGKDLKLGARSRVRVGKIAERLSIRRSTTAGRIVVVRFSRGEFSALEYVLALALGE